MGTGSACQCAQEWQVAATPPTGKVRGADLLILHQKRRGGHKKIGNLKVHHVTLLPGGGGGGEGLPPG